MFKEKIQDFRAFFKTGDRLLDQFRITSITFWTLLVSIIFLVKAGVVAVSDQLLFYYTAVIIFPIALILSHILAYLVSIQKVLLLKTIFLVFFSFSIVHLTGGIYSPFWFLYFLPVVISLLVFEGKACQFILVLECILILLPLINSPVKELLGHFSLLFLRIFGLTVIAEFGFFLCKRSAFERLERERQKQELEESRNKMTAVNRELMIQQGHLIEITDALEKANENLKKLDEIKSDFVSMVSHELRTPLTSIKEGVTLILDSSLGEINENQEKILMISKNNVDRLTDLINDILDLSKLELGRIDLHLKPTDVASVVTNVFETYKYGFEKKNMQFDLDIKSELPLIVTDQDRFVQILTNLISNSMKFTPENGHVSITVDSLNKSEVKKDVEQFSKEEWILNEYQFQEVLAQTYRFIRFVISDTGCGIPKEESLKIFEKFTMVRSRDGEKKPPGTGLGLAIVKRLVIALKGAIFLDSEVNRGTTISLYFAVSPENEELADIKKTGESHEKRKHT